MQAYALSPHLKRTNKSYRVDETYIKAKDQKYLYRAVDSTGQTIDFLVVRLRLNASFKGYLLPCHPVPRVIDVDKNPSNPAAIRILKKEGALPRRPFTPVQVPE